MSEMPFYDGLGGDAVLGVVGDLDRAAAVGLVDRGAASRRSPCRRTSAPCPSTFRAARPIVWIRLVSPRRKPSLSASRIADQRDLGQVEALAQQVHADEHVVLAEPQVADDLDPLDRVDLGVQVAAPGTRTRAGSPVRSSAIFFVSVVTSTRSFASARARISFIRSSIWCARLAHLDLGVDDPGRPDDLLDDPRRVLALERPRRRRHEHHLRHALEELVEPQRPVVERRRQAEAVVDQRRACASGRPRTSRRSGEPSGATRR